MVSRTSADRVQLPIQALGAPSFGRIQGGDQSQTPQRRLENPVLRHVVAQFVEGAVRLSVEQQVALHGGCEIELALEAPDVLVDGEVVPIKPARDEPRDAFVQNLGEQVDQPAELLGSDIDRLPFPDMVPSVAEEIVDVPDRNLHASSALISPST